jgi:NAD(P)-dependent dehydrogenase (short-subunit alcohol dehydrogenase family)
MDYILVTGASGKNGGIIVRHLLSKGYFVIGCGSGPETAKRLRNAYPERFQSVAIDLADEASCAAGVETIASILDSNPLAGMIHAASLATPGELSNLPLEDLRRHFEVNVYGFLEMCKLCLPLLRKKKGRIVLANGGFSEEPKPGSGASAASARALMNLAHTIRREFIPYGVDLVEVVASGAELANLAHTALTDEKPRHRYAPEPVARVPMIWRPRNKQPFPGKHLLITGVSSGVGYGCLQYFTGLGCHVFGSVRKEEDARRLQEEFGENYTPLLFDVTDPAAIARAAAAVKAKLGEAENLSGLVVNAGIQIPGPLTELSREDMRFQFDVNVLGALGVAQAFIPLLKGGRIVHIGSTSAAITLPFTSLYAASKSAMHGICDALRAELEPAAGIGVVDIYVGPVKNELINKVIVYKDRYAGSDYADAISFRLDNALSNTIPKGLPLPVVAAAVHQALAAPNPKPRFAINRDWLNHWVLPNLLPPRTLDRIIAKRWKMRPKDFARINRT